MLTIQELEALRGLVQINVNINLPKGHHMAYDRIRLPVSWKPASVSAEDVSAAFAIGVFPSVSLPAGLTELTVETTKLANLVSNGAGSSLTKLDASIVTAIPGQIYFGGFTSLTDVRLNNLTIAGTPVSFAGCALTEASVDGVLLALVNSTSNGVDLWGANGEECDLSGGTNAIPSAAGLASKATLDARGAAVTVNS